MHELSHETRDSTLVIQYAKVTHSTCTGCNLCVTIIYSSCTFEITWMDTDVP